MSQKRTREEAVKCLTLVSSDHQEIEVNYNYFTRISPTIRNLVEDCGDESKIPIPAPGVILKSVIKALFHYVKHHELSSILNKDKKSLPLLIALICTLIFLDVPARVLVDLWENLVQLLNSLYRSNIDEYRESLCVQNDFSEVESQDIHRVYDCSPLLWKNDIFPSVRSMTRPVVRPEDNVYFRDGCILTIPNSFLIEKVFPKVYWVTLSKMAQTCRVMYHRVNAYLVSYARSYIPSGLETIEDAIDAGRVLRSFPPSPDKPGKKVALEVFLVSDAIWKSLGGYSHDVHVLLRESIQRFRTMERFLAERNRRVERRNEKRAAKERQKEEEQRLLDEKVEMLNAVYAPHGFRLDDKNEAIPFSKEEITSDSPKVLYYLEHVLNKRVRRNMEARDFTSLYKYTLLWKFKELVASL